MIGQVAGEVFGEVLDRFCGEPFKYFRDPIGMDIGFGAKEVIGKAVEQGFGVPLAAYLLVFDNQMSIHKL